MFFLKAIKNFFTESRDSKKPTNFSEQLKRHIEGRKERIIRNSGEEKAKDIFIQSLQYIIDKENPELFCYIGGDEKFFNQVEKDINRDLKDIKKEIYCDKKDIQSILGKKNITSLENNITNNISANLRKYIDARIVDLETSIPSNFYHFSIFSCENTDHKKEYLVRLETDTDTKKGWFSANMDEEQVNNIKRKFRQQVEEQVTLI